MMDSNAGGAGSTIAAARPASTGDVGGPGGTAATLFNSSIGAFAVVSAAQLGLFDEITDAGWVELPGYARRHDLHEQTLRAIVDALVTTGVLRIDRDVVTGGEGFADVFATKGFFVWLLGGCGELLRTGGSVARQANRRGRFIHRDAAVISVGTGDFGARFIDPVFDAAFAQHRFSRIADLGCGGGSRLIRALRANPGATGVGVDHAPQAVELARRQLADAGLADRALIVEADVHALEQHPEFAEVDFVTSFLMGHDFWPRERCVRVLRNLRRVFPAARSFALCDTYRSGAAPGPELPILTLGFEYVHALMGQYVPTLGEWREVLRVSGWQIQREHDLVLPPYSTIFHLAPAGPDGGNGG